MSSLLQDFRHGLRVLAKSPGFTAVAIVTLALGVGANTAIFSLLDQVLMRRLPVPHPEELVVMHITGSSFGRVWSDGDPSESIPYPVYAAIRDDNPAFSGLLGRFAVNLSVAFRGTTERALSSSRRQPPASTAKTTPIRPRRRARHHSLWLSFRQVIGL